MIKLVVQSCRIRQWVKNGVVLAPVVFAGRLTDRPALLHAGVAVACFCLASSGAYLINDLADRRTDRFHPSKRTRPIPSGRLPVPMAAWCAAVLSVTAWLAGATIDARLSSTILLYLLLNVSYSLLLKRVAILDVLTLSVGFVLRVWGGAVAIDLVPSHWLQLSVFFLALFLSLAKRRQELVILHGDALRHRGVLSDYSPALIDQLTSIAATTTVLCYALYVISPEVTSRLGPFGFLLTVPLVIYGVFRYLYLMHIRQEAIDPTEAFWLDRPLASSVLLWSLVVLAMLYR